MQQHKVGILTGGGDCPGLNAVIRAVVQKIANAGGECVGLLEGWRGLVQRPRATPCDGKPQGWHPQGPVQIGLLPLQSGAARLFQAQNDPVLEPIGAFIQGLADPVRELDFIHSVIPRASNACAKACVAREQCVLTLPSEQPIAAAVSATSMSSQ